MYKTALTLIFVVSHDFQGLSEIVRIQTEKARFPGGTALISESECVSSTLQNKLQMSLFQRVLAKREQSLSRS